MMETPYQRVACGFYDEMERYAMQRRTVQITQSSESGGTTYLVTIADVLSLPEGEFLVTESGERIRLDLI